MDGWDLAILVAAAYLATMALVRLMIRRRDQVLVDSARRWPRHEKPNGQAELAEQQRARQKAKAA